MLFNVALSLLIIEDVCLEPYSNRLSPPRQLAVSRTNTACPLALYRMSIPTSPVSISTHLVRGSFLSMLPAWKLSNQIYSLRMCSVHKLALVPWEPLLSSVEFVRQEDQFSNALRRSLFLTFTRWLLTGCKI